MPTYTYKGDDTRYYPALAVTASPGTTADLAEQPTDGRWELAQGNFPPSPAPAVPADAPPTTP